MRDAVTLMLALPDLGRQAGGLRVAVEHPLDQLARAGDVESGFVEQVEELAVVASKDSRQTCHQPPDALRARPDHLHVSLPRGQPYSGATDYGIDRLSGGGSPPPPLAPAELLDVRARRDVGRLGRDDFVGALLRAPGDPGHLRL